jgi:hypothetical protein
MRHYFHKKVEESQRMCESVSRVKSMECSRSGVRDLIRNLANYLKFSQLDQWDAAFVEAAATNEVEFSVSYCC